jgi:acetyl esterase/lipase
MKYHPITPEDQATLIGLRPIQSAHKGGLRGIGARQPFDEIMERTAVAEGITFEAGILGGISGWWCRVESAPAEAAVLYLHGGFFNWGSAKAYRNLASHVAQRTQTNVFVADYRLAPEHPFPSGSIDAVVAYDALRASGYDRITLVGDSAGGALCLEVLAQRNDAHAAVLLSPITDLTFSGGSWETRAAADPYFTLEQAQGLIETYLAGAEARAASPLYAEYASLPPVLIIAGEDEMLYDDSRAIAERISADFHVWQGMAHVFVTSVGTLHAADEALDLIASFSARVSQERVQA